MRTSEAREARCLRHFGLHHSFDDAYSTFGFRHFPVYDAGAVPND